MPGQHSVFESQFGKSPCKLKKKCDKDTIQAATWGNRQCPPCQSYRGALPPSSKKFLVSPTQDLLSDQVFPELHRTLKATFFLFGDCEVLGFIISWVGTLGWAGT